jgi:hypothetical protein
MVGPAGRPGGQQLPLRIGGCGLPAPDNPEGAWTSSGAACSAWTGLLGCAIAGQPLCVLADEDDQVVEEEKVNMRQAGPSCIARSRRPLVANASQKKEHECFLLQSCPCSQLKMRWRKKVEDADFLRPIMKPLNDHVQRVKDELRVLESGQTSGRPQSMRFPFPYPILGS